MGRQILRLVFVCLFRQRSLRAALYFLSGPHFLGVVEALVYCGGRSRAFRLLVTFLHMRVTGAVFGISLRLVVSGTILVHFLCSESCSLRRTIAVPIVQLRGAPPSESCHGGFSCRPG